MAKKDKTKIQGVILDTILVQSVNAVIGYVAVWLFKPLWTKIIGIWKKKDESESNIS